MFDSLSVPNYRKYFFGALTSNVGMWLNRTAATWLVLVELTDGDMSAIGVLTGLMFLPALLLSVPAGSVADRVPKRRIMIAANTVVMLDAALLGVLTLTGQIQLWHVFAITLIDGAAGSIDSPARQAFVSELVPRSLLPNAIGLNSASFNAARLLGPGVAGVLIAAIGTGPVFFFGMAGSALLIWVQATLDASALRPSPAPAPGSRGVIEGLRYVRNRPELVLLLAIGFMMGNFGFNFPITNPAMSTYVFGKGPTEFGILGSLMGVGALSAALWSAARPKPRLRFIIGGLAGYVVVQFLTALAPTFELFALAQIPLGLATITVLVTANTLLQTSLDPAVRGRVMALWMLFLLGGTPVVGPAVGWVGTVFGPRAAVQIGTVSMALTLAAALVYLIVHARVRMRLQLSARHPLVVYYAEPEGRR